MIEEFRGKYYFLSNYFKLKVPVKLGSLEFYYVESAYAASKTLDESKRKQFQLCKSPGESKKLGRKLKLRDDWEAVKIDTMRDLVKQKFDNNSDLKERLLDTGDRKLIEGNAWGVSLKYYKM